MSAVPFAFSISMRDVSRALLLLERRLLLVGDLALGQHLDELLREHDVLDVDALRLDLVLAARYSVIALERGAPAPAGGSR